MAYCRVAVEDVGRFSVYRIRRAIKRYKKNARFEYSKIRGILDYLFEWKEEVLNDVKIFDESKKNEMDSEANLFVIDTPSVLNPDLMLSKEPAEIYDSVQVDPKDPRLNKDPLINVFETKTEENPDDEATKLNYPELNSD